MRAYFPKIAELASFDICASSSWKRSRKHRGAAELH
jgi:hypothetical protein